MIEAGAGTGKTSTSKVAADRMSGRGIYLAYNKAIAQDAAASFPAQVQCRTAHSMAYATVGKRSAPVAATATYRETFTNEFCGSVIPQSRRQIARK